MFHQRKKGGCYDSIYKQINVCKKELIIEAAELQLFPLIPNDKDAMNICKFRKINEPVQYPALITIVRFFLVLLKRVI